MTDIVTREKRSRMMAGIKAQNTRPEILVRKLLHSMGYRFRLYRKDILGKPDIYLAKYHTVIMVHGCFWHGHDHCHLFRLPKSRTEFWRDKIYHNRRRDALVQKELLASGYRYLEIWECTLKGKGAIDPCELSIIIDDFLKTDSSRFKSIRGIEPVGGNLPN